MQIEQLPGGGSLLFCGQSAFSSLEVLLWFDVLLMLLGSSNQLPGFINFKHRGQVTPGFPNQPFLMTFFRHRNCITFQRRLHFFGVGNFRRMRP